MSDIRHDVVVSSRVRLARNYCDLPFPKPESRGNGQICVDRAKEALLGASSANRFILRMIGELAETERMALVERHLISRDLLHNGNHGAALVRDDCAVSIMINEEDHLRIQAMLGGLKLDDAAVLAYEAEETLQQKCMFSFDAQLGYLTACPTNTGTGMRASLMLHLPLLTEAKQMGNVAQSVAKLGLTIRGSYGEGSDALGDLYQVSNQVTLGRTEKEILDAVIAVGNQLIDKEGDLRSRVASDALTGLQDRVMRSYGILRYALQMDSSEFMRHWSNLRLGAALKLIPAELEVTDELLTTAQDANAMLYREKHKPSLSVEQARMEVIQTALNTKKEKV